MYFMYGLEDGNIVVAHIHTKEVSRIIRMKMSRYENI
jgi:hypothetical protein